MGKILSVVSNPFKNFNLESRAHKVIEQSKPIPAPKHKKDEIGFDRLMKGSEYPEVYEESLRKNEQLDKHLKDVYVTSRDPEVNVKQNQNPNRPLPSDRTSVDPFLYGVKEPDKIPLGKTTLRKALEFITEHQNEPQKFTSKKISEDYSIPEDTIKSILKFYRVFEIYIPQERKTKAKFAGPSLPKVQILKELRKKLPPGPEKSEKT